MRAKQLLQLINKIAQDNNIEVMICGGIPRSKIIGSNDKINDIDITTGNFNVHKLAKLTVQALPGSNHKIHSDGHLSLFYDKLKIDFSSNFRIPGIKFILEKMGIKNPSELEQEIYSRDFNINSLLMTMDLKTIKDPTGQGIKDCKNKIIRTILPPEITFPFNLKRVPRVLYMSAKLNFDVDPKIIEWISDNKKSMISCKPRYLNDKLSEAFKYNEERTLALLDEMDLWSTLPAIPALIPYMQKGRI